MRASRSNAIGWTAPELAADPNWVFRSNGELVRARTALMGWAASRQDPLEAGHPLGQRALADLDALDATLQAPRFRHEFLLEAGDLLFVDNHRLAHDRTAYSDGAGPPRLMLRLWVNAK